ncbi:MAG: hypothetical protein JSV48_16220, partial [Bradyrhizobium sp.]
HKNIDIVLEQAHELDLAGIDLVVAGAASGPTSVNHRITRQRGKLYRPASDCIPRHPISCG